MIRERSAGAVVFRRDPEGVRLLLIRDRFGRWSLPKGHIEEGETPAEAALRELAEETGVRGRVAGELPGTRYSFRRGPDTVEKEVAYFLAEAVGGTPSPQPGEIEEVRWVAPAEIWDLHQYEDNVPVLRAALERLGVGGDTAGTERAGKDRSGSGGRGRRPRRGEVARG